MAACAHLGVEGCLRRAGECAGPPGEPISPIQTFNGVAENLNRQSATSLPLPHGTHAVPGGTFLQSADSIRASPGWNCAVGNDE